MMDQTALYLHIPFCVKKCAYCDFVSYPGRCGDVARYLRALGDEMRGAAVEFGRLKIGSVFFGGGTPSLLSGEQVVELMAEIVSAFDIAPDAEITLEANPGTVNLNKLREYRRAGVNRLSIGVQAMQDSLLRSLGRIHTAVQAVEAVRLARDAGFDNLSLDLMYALPGQSARDWRETVERALDMNPRHLSMYSLIVEPGTPLYGAVERGELVPPDEDAAGEFQSIAEELSTAAGLRRYEISNYALPGFECRHNLTYWRRQNYLGLGCAAHSMMQDVRFYNTDSLDEYLSGTVRAGSRPIPLDERREEALMLGLRMAEGIDLAQFEWQFGENLSVTRQSALALLTRGGFARMESGRCMLTSRGMNVQNAVLMKLL